MPVSYPRFANRDLSALPTRFYNLKADLPVLPPPPLHPGTRKPIVPADLEPVFSKGFIAHEGTLDRFVPGFPGPCSKRSPCTARRLSSTPRA